MEPAALVLVGVAGLAGLGLWQAARRRRARAREVTEGVATRLGAHLGTSRWATTTAFLDYQDLVCGVYHGYGPEGELTGVFFKLEPDEVPDAGSVRVHRRGRASVADYAAKKPKVVTGDAAFDGEYRIACADADKGFAFRWLDADGRRLVQELARRQDREALAPTVEYLAEDRVVHFWAEGHLEAELDLDPLLEFGARLARRVTGKSRPEEKPAEPEGPIEV